VIKAIVFGFNIGRLALYLDPRCIGAMASPNFTGPGNNRDHEYGRSASQDSSDSPANLLFPIIDPYHQNGELTEDVYESEGNGLQRQRLVLLLIPFPVLLVVL
jgi:hypothetical protein